MLFSETPMSWADAIDTALSKGKRLPNYCTMKYLVENRLVPPFGIMWTSTTNSQDTHMACVKDGEKVDRLGKLKTDRYHFIMINPEDQIKCNINSITYRVGD